jgi:hypothetical protein
VRKSEKIMGICGFLKISEHTQSFNTENFKILANIRTLDAIKPFLNTLKASNVNFPYSKRI